MLLYSATGINILDFAEDAALKVCLTLSHPGDSDTKGLYQWHKIYLLFRHMMVATSVLHAIIVDLERIKLLENAFVTLKSGVDKHVKRQCLEMQHLKNKENLV